MTDTKELIQQLSAQATPVKGLRLRRYAIMLLAMLGAYAICAQCWLDGLRSDLSLQLTRPLFVAELVLLSAMLICALVAALHAMLPDGVARTQLLRLPYYCSGAVLALVACQLVLGTDARMIVPEAPVHTLECTAYIALSSMLPAALMFAILRRGASVVPMQAGGLAVVASVSLGALTLRLAEANDAIMHLLVWHYLPGIFFAVFGAILGRYLLRW